MDALADLMFALTCAAFAHFGVSVEMPEREQPQVQRTVARVQAPKPAAVAKARTGECPEKTAKVHRI